MSLSHTHTHTLSDLVDKRADKVDEATLQLGQLVRFVPVHHGLQARASLIGCFRISEATAALRAGSYDRLLLQDRPLQVALLPELRSHRQRHLQDRAEHSRGLTGLPKNTSWSSR